MTPTEKLLKDAFGEQRVKTHEPMSKHTSLHTGGLAELYVEVEKTEDLFTAVTIAADHDVPITILGSGTSALVSDNGIAGLVIKNNCRKFELLSMVGKVRNQQIAVDKAYVYAEAGALMNSVVRYVIEQGYGGLEYALGLPGTVGGALTTNASYPPANFSIGDRVHKAKVLKPTGEIAEVGQEYFHFQLQKSTLIETGDIVLSVMFALTPSQQSLLWQRGDEALAFRTSFEKEGQHRPSTYRVITISKTETLVHNSPLPDVSFLLSHSGLLESKHGAMMLCKDNPNFIINCGEGKTSDVIGLLSDIKQKIKAKYTIDVDVQMKQIGL
jgi:UDP-N-acetylmuramate dehydrogenase